MRKILNNFKFIVISFIRLLFNYIGGGADCVICGNVTYRYPVCKKCRERYFEISRDALSNRCKVCGRELISTKNICSRCKKEHIINSGDNVTPLFSYRLWNKELVFLWKIKGERNLSFFFARLVDKALKILGYNIIVPVPPRKGKIKKNGWDQVDELCTILSYKYGYTVLKLLQRLSSEEQKKLGRKERLEAVKNSYRLANGKILKKELKKTGGKLPKEVCLIDDVFTTGSTVECCCKILKELNIDKINVLTLFIVD